MPHRDPERVPGRPLVVAGAAVAAATFAFGFVHEAAGGQLGVPSPPSNYYWRPMAEPAWAAAAVVLFAAVVAALPRLVVRPRPVAAFLALSFLVALALRVVLAAARHGPEGWYRVLDPELNFEGKNEYLPALGALEYGERFLIDRFAELVPALPVHAAGHPPGLLLVLHWTGLTTPEGMAALSIPLAALGAPATYALGRTLLAGEAGPRIAALLFALSPSAVIHGAVSADAVYATMGAVTAALLLARPAALRLAGALAFALASFFSWALLAVGAFAAAAVALRRGLRDAVVLAAAAGAALLAFHAALAALLGWDPVGTVRATEEVYRVGIQQIRPYWFWWIGSPVAAFVTMGLPIAAWWLRAVAARDAAAIALAAVVVVSALSGFTKGEVERIWLMFVPLACVAAAGVLPRRRVAWVGGLLALQALATELLLDTLW